VRVPRPARDGERGPRLAPLAARPGAGGAARRVSRAGVTPDPARAARASRPPLRCQVL